MKKILLVTFVLILSILSWGNSKKTNAIHFQEGFSTASVPDGWTDNTMYYNTTANHGTFSGSYGAGFNAIDDWIQTSSINTAGTLSFWIKGTVSSSQIGLKIQKSYNATDWTDIETYDLGRFTTEWENISVIINDNNTTIYIRFFIHNRTGNSLYIDDIELSNYSTSASSLNITSTTELTETNLGSTPITLTLANETFVASLQNSYFTLNNAPTGTSIESVSRISDTEATINLDFDNTDFDIDINNFSITATADALSGTDPITSNEINITACSAPLATTNTAIQTLNGDATLNGTVTSNGLATTVTFEYSTDATLTTGVLNLTASQSPLATDAENAAVTVSLSGLTIGQTYYFRAVATNTEGTTQGEILSFTSIAPPTLIISEVADPLDVANAKFVEIFNTGSSAIDLAAANIYLVRQANGSSVANIALTGNINPNETYTISYNNADFHNSFGFYANQISGSISCNGNDGYCLYANGDYSTGTLFDAYGVLNEDGTGKTWEYTDSKAVRNLGSSPTSTWSSLEWKITNNCPTSRMSPALHPAKVWNGNADNVWNNPNNWDDPVIALNVVIWGGAANFPQLITSTPLIKLRLTHNAQLNGQEFLTVTGTTTVQHQIDFSTAHDNLNNWQYFTSPFTGTTTGNMLSSNERVDLYMIQYDNTLEPLEANRNEAWAWLEENSDAVSPGTGYAVTAVNDLLETGDGISTTYYNMALSGSLVSASSNVTIGLSYTGAEETDNNWNLIGNPFLAPIEWTSSSYSGNIQGGTAYIYDRTKTEDGNYITIQNGTSSPVSYGTYIPAMQGFFVSAAATGSIEIKPSARVNNTQNFYKSQDNKALLRIQLSSGTKTDETVIVFNEMAEAKFDKYDGLKMMGSLQNPQIYTTADSGHKLVFNNTNDLSQTIDLQITAPTEGTYTIGFGEISGLFNNYNISITDYKHQKSLSITDEQYQFEVDVPGEVLNFSLSFSEETGFNDHSKQSLLVYAQNGEIIISSANDHSGTVSVYTLAGKKLTSQTVCGTYSLIDFNNKQGVYVVEHKGAINTTFHKVVINQ